MIYDTYIIMKSNSVNWYFEYEIEGWQVFYVLRSSSWLRPVPHSRIFDLNADLVYSNWYLKCHALRAKCTARSTLCRLQPADARSNALSRICKQHTCALIGHDSTLFASERNTSTTFSEHKSYCNDRNFSQRPPNAHSTLSEVIFWEHTSPICEH